MKKGVPLPPRDQEAEANAFAMVLLMPENLVNQAVKKMGGVDLCNDEAMQELSKMFRVPVTLMAIRVGQIYGIK